MILALDLGSTTGYATSGVNHPVCGSIPLATRRELEQDKKTRGNRRIDIRAIALRTWLGPMFRAWRPSVVVFEDVKFARSQAQAHLWASFRGIVWACCIEHGIQRVDCLNTSTLKKFATGNGHADKDQIRLALLIKEPDAFVEIPGENYIRQVATGNFLDDNAIDAYFLLQWAQSVYQKPA